MSGLKKLKNVSTYSALQKNSWFCPFPLLNGHFLMRVLSHNSHAIPVNTSLQKMEGWRVPKRYYLFMCLKGLQSCMMSKFQYSSNITFFFLYVRWKQCHLWTLNFSRFLTLTNRNFIAPWAIWVSNTFLEASNLILIRVRYSWGWEDF